MNNEQVEVYVSDWSLNSWTTENNFDGHRLGLFLSADINLEADVTRIVSILEKYFNDSASDTSLEQFNENEIYNFAINGYADQMYPMKKVDNKLKFAGNYSDIAMTVLYQKIVRLEGKL